MVFVMAFVMCLSCPNILNASDIKFLFSSSVAGKFKGLLKHLVSETVKVSLPRLMHCSAVSQTFLRSSASESSKVESKCFRDSVFNFFSDQVLCDL